jgi:hypothetical protein
MIDDRLKPVLRTRAACYGAVDDGEEAGAVVPAESP